MTASSFSGFKLPPGRHGLPREYVAENQRWRLLGAAAELLAEGGYRSLTSSTIARRAAVSSKAFHVHFENVEDCIRAVFEVGAQNLEAAVKRGCGKNTTEPPESIAGAAGEAMALFAQEPVLQRLLSLETMSAAPMIARTWSRLVGSLGSRLQRLLDLPEGGSSIRSRLLVQAALVTLSETATPDLDGHSRLADQLATLISRGWAPCS